MDGAPNSEHRPMTVQLTSDFTPLLLVKEYRIKKEWPALLSSQHHQKCKQKTKKKKGTRIKGQKFFDHKKYSAWSEASIGGGNKLKIQSKKVGKKQNRLPPHPCG